LIIGFVDAEGSFHVSFSEKNKKFVQNLFDLPQKGADNKEVIFKKISLTIWIGTFVNIFTKIIEV